jgi:hypothetical protein
MASPRIYRRRAQFRHSPATADDWQFIGPKNFGARVISLAVDPKNANHVFARGASESWRYVDTGF